METYQVEMANSNAVDVSTRIEDLKYLYASNVNVSNFVSVKLSDDRKYHIWKAQMLCLMESQKMRGIVDAKFDGPGATNKEIMKQYDSLLRGWILGSLSEDVLSTVVDLESAKTLWTKLKSYYDPEIRAPQDSAPTTSEVETETKTNDIDAVTEETNKNDEDMLEIVSTITEIVSTENKTDGEDAKNRNEIKQKKYYRSRLRSATHEGDWKTAIRLLEGDRDLVGDVISYDGNTVLHIAVGISNNDFLKNLISYLNDEQVLKKRDLDGSTALHIAAIVGNKYAADLLVKKNKALLRIKDSEEKEPLHKAFENMHLDTIGYLLKAVFDDGKDNEQFFHLHPDVGLGGVDLLVNAISAKQYDFALDLIIRFPKIASKSDDVLMAIAKTFPSGLDYWQTLIYPSFRDPLDKILRIFMAFLKLLFCLPMVIIWLLTKKRIFEARLENRMPLLVGACAVPAMIGSVFVLIYLVILIIRALFLTLYSVLWKAAKILEGPIKNIENKKKEWDEAKTVLAIVCDEIGNLEFSGTHHPYFTRPILKAACQNAYEVVDEILYRSPESIQSTDKNGYDIIQLAIIHRSEKIFNLIFDIGERKNLYRTVEDSSKNNILHLAGRLAPSHELNRRRGAALQLQRELQWRAEVKKHIFPTYMTRENVLKETPDMVFTREHERLMKEGEIWMKSTAESCSITAALITTIVFAAAITVPGGNDQAKGIPLFTENVAFNIFAVSDAISLFSSSTALLVFLSILTARFAENDFLVSLPSRMLIGLFSLLLSTIAMMVAFSATLFLVFCHQKPWMLAPICVLAFIPIGFFVALQFPLIVDLFQSTHLRIFGKQRKKRFNPDSKVLNYRGTKLYIVEE